MAPVRDYAKLAKDIVTVVREDNIISAAHCATRLRLVLKESPSEEVTKKITEMPAVIQVVENGGQYQIVIGMHAKDVYEELTKIIKLEENAAEAAGGNQSFISKVIATMSAVFAPFVYILAAAGLIQGCLIIANLIAPAFAETGTYAVISFISWTPFTFLPVFIAVTASKHFKCNTFIAVACCCALVNPDWASMAARIAEGEDIKFLFFKLAQTTYTSTVLPPLFLVLVLAALERFLEKRLPDVTKAILTPFLCMLIMVPATLLIIGPISDIAANGIAIGYNSLYNTVPAVAAALIGGFWEVAVIFGVHWGVTPMVMANFANYGCDSFQAVQTCAVAAQAAACFGVFIKSRNKEMKNVSFSSGITGIFGITEPAIYGVTLRLKKPFIAGCISGAVGALVVAFFDARNYVYAGLPGILTTVNAISSENKMSFPGMLMGCAVAAAGAIILVQVLGFDDPVSEPETADDGMDASDSPEAVSVFEAEGKGAAVTIYAPMNGEMKPLEEVNDPVFASGAMGQGAAIVPNEGKLYAPFDGTVAMVFDTLHAVGLVNDAGVEMLIHIGLDTVKLNGKHFTAKVKVGDTVKTGDLLIEFDKDEIAKEYSMETPVIITNVDCFEKVDTVTAAGSVQAGTPLLKVISQQNVLERKSGLTGMKGDKR